MLNSAKKSMSNVRSDVKDSSPATRVIFGIIVIIIIAVIIWAIFAAVNKFSKNGSNSQEGFSNDEKYALVYIHMDGCSYCRKFDPTWKELKKDHVKHFKSIGVDMKDYESKSEEAALLKPNGYPTILLTKDGKKVATFQEDRTIGALVSFVETNVKAQ